MLSRLATVSRSGKGVVHAARVIPRLVSTTNSSKNPETAVSTPESKSVWQIYKDKAGLSAPTVFGIGLSAYLLSKEILIIHEETVLAVVMGGTIYYLVKRFGKDVADGLDAYSQDILDKMNAGRQAKMKALEEAIADEKSVEQVYSCRDQIYDILKENNAMKLEAEYRANLNQVYEEVKKRLDYQVDLQQLKKDLEQEHLVKWLENAVIKSITPQQEKDSMTQCIKDIKLLATAKAA